MHAVTLDEAKNCLPDLINEAVKGGEVVIRKDAATAVKLVPLANSTGRPQFGSAKGLIEMSDDFDEPLEDFADYMP